MKYLIAENMKIIECPRDAMQGIKKFIPTNLKIEYLNSLLKVGFNTLDCGSFVSPQSIPQMADTFRSEGKIYVVIAVLSIIFVCLIAYLIYIDIKVKKLEKSKNR